VICQAGQGNDRVAPRRVIFAFTNTGKGHKSTADALAESVTLADGDHPPVQVAQVDIYQLAKVFLFRKAGRHYEILCRHASWFYDILFRVTDNPTAKKLITRAILRVYGQRLARTMSRIDPDVVVVVHPLFVSDVLCELRNRSGAKWKVVSFVTDLGVAHAGWTGTALDSALFVSPEQVRKLSSQGCLPLEGRTAVTKAPVRRVFTEYNRSVDEKVIETLGLEQPYILYVPGLQSARALARQVRHLTDAYQGIPIAVVGSISPRLIAGLKNINRRLIYLSSLSDFEMAAAMRNAEIVSGKAGPAVMAEAANVGTHFVPTAEVGLQEAGNAAAGKALYGTDAAPWWAEVYSGRTNRTPSRIMASERYPVIDETEALLLLIDGGV
jgi:UDP-N-acetylglucosamine:LPS N-acetylglucosamine transferase